LGTSEESPDLCGIRLHPQLPTGSVSIDQRVIGQIAITGTHARLPNCALGLPPHRSARKPGAPLRPAQIIATILRAFPSFHTTRQHKLSRRVRPPPGGCLLDLCSASVRTPGRLRVGQVGWNLLASARPRSVGAVPGKERCSLCCNLVFLEVIRISSDGWGLRVWASFSATDSDRFDGGCAPPNPAPLAAAGVRGERLEWRFARLEAPIHAGLIWSSQEP
jgi:hypothetical protein